MASEWRLTVSPGAVRLARGWLPDPERPELRPFGWHRRWAAGTTTALRRSGQGDSGQSARSRLRMRWLFASLPWERLVMLSLTYPGEWREWVPDGRKFDAHRRAFLERWRRRWGAPAGVWVKEFQESGRPHMHLFLAIPDAVPDEEFEGFRQRTLLRRRLEREFGRYRGRGKVPAIGLKYGGDFAMWLRNSWSEVVGTQGVSKAHHVHQRGAQGRLPRGVTFPVHVRSGAWRKSSRCRGDFSHPQAGEPESDHDLVAQTQLGRITTRAHELAEGFLMGQPTARVAGLHLAVRASIRAQNGLSRSRNRAPGLRSTRPVDSHQRRKASTFVVRW